MKAANLLIDDDGTVLLGDLGVAADLAEDTSHHPSTTKPHSITAAAALVQPRSSNDHGSGKRGTGFDGSPPSVPRPTIGKRKSFVGTVSRALKQRYQLVLNAMFSSPVGCRLSSFKANNMIHHLISGVLVSLRWS